MDTAVFSVQLHQPFLVSSGLSGEGLDSRARSAVPLPATSLKGVMRASATHVLGIPGELVDAVYGREGKVGHPGGSAAWGWTDAGPLGAFEFWSRSRNRLDSQSGGTLAEALTNTEEIWQKPGRDIRFAVEPLIALSTQDAEMHRAILQASAYGVTAIGSWRNRGMGAVTMRPVAPIEGLDSILRKVTHGSV
ncbi:MAG: hypothetical protein L0H25_01755 [Micrococcales bacterium]|nr:hypothetical protein [Micrococcales bacterium]